MAQPFIGWTYEVYQSGRAFWDRANEKTLLWKHSILLLSLAACQTSAPQSCSGWERISVKPATAVYLAGNDITAGQGIASHNNHGRNAGCWK